MGVYSSKSGQVPRSYAVLLHLLPCPLPTPSCLSKRSLELRVYPEHAIYPLEVRTMIQLCRAEDGAVVQLDVTLWDLERYALVHK